MAGIKARQSHSWPWQVARHRQTGASRPWTNPKLRVAFAEGRATRGLSWRECCLHRQVRGRSPERPRAGEEGRASRIPPGGRPLEPAAGSRGFRPDRCGESRRRPWEAGAALRRSEPARRAFEPRFLAGMALHHGNRLVGCRAVEGHEREWRGGTFFVLGRWADLVGPCVAGPAPRGRFLAVDSPDGERRRGIEPHGRPTRSRPAPRRLEG